MITEKLITDEMVQDALLHLAVSSEHEASARAMRERLDFERKRIRATNILNATHQPNATMREAWAETQTNYTAATAKYCDAIEQDELMRSKRNTAIVVIDAWRTQNANDRASKDFR